MANEFESSEVAQLRRERDLYLRLLKLGSQNEIAPFVAEALHLVAEVAGAHHGYLELCRDEDDQSDAPLWWAAHGFSAAEVEAVRAELSRGIIAATLRSGQTIATRSAILDPRFHELESVRTGQIEAVLCAPIGAEPPLGVLYLQRRVEPGSFSEMDRAMIEMVARHLAPYVERLLARQRRSADDPTRPLREKLHIGELIGRSAALAAVLREVAVVAPLEVNVLLTGESGTGKSQIARIIHDNGPRAGHPMVELNCAAIPESLVESELFGAVRGAHSTATTKLEGKVAAAEGGTLLLDEVGELPLPAQAKLLQLLQSKIYYPLGSAKPVRADVRVIAATNVDLESAVREHRFREDLFYRLQVLPLRLPTLAERREDIVELAQHFCAASCERHRLPRLAISSGSLRALQAATWPGNIRQLANVVEAAVIRAAALGAEQVERGHVFPQGAGDAAGDGERLTFQEATRRFQARLVREALLEANGNIVETARRLDLTRSHVYNLINAFGLTRERK